MPSASLSVTDNSWFTGGNCNRFTSCVGDVLDVVGCDFDFLPSWSRHHKCRKERVPGNRFVCNIYMRNICFVSLSDYNSLYLIKARPKRQVSRKGDPSKYQLHSYYYCSLLLFNSNYCRVHAITCCLKCSGYF